MKYNYLHPRINAVHICPHETLAASDVIGGGIEAIVADEDDDESFEKIITSEVNW